MGLADAITNHISCRYLYTTRDFNTSASPTISIRYGREYARLISLNLELTFATSELLLHPP